MIHAGFFLLGGNEVKKVKNFIVVLMLSLTLFNSVFYSYSLTVQAAEVIPAMTALEALLSLFGLELGLGEQTDFFSNPEFSDFVTAVANGETVSLPSYGDVNFSDGESILSFMAWASALTYSVADGNVLNAAKVLDSTSYKNSGTSATNAMEQQISSLSGKYSSSETLAEDIQDTFSVAAGSSDNAVMTSSRWDIFTGMVSAFMLGTAERIKELAGNFTTPEETEYQDYETAFGELSIAYWDGSFDVDESGNYIVDFYYAAGGGSANSYQMKNYWFNCSYSKPVIGDISSGSVCLKYYNDSSFSFLKFGSGTQTILDGNAGGGYSDSSGIVISLDYFKGTNVPIFVNSDAALYFLTNGVVENEGDIVNYEDETAYPTFKKVASTASATLSAPLTKWLDTGVAVDTIPDVATKVLDASRSAIGKLDYVATVDTAIQEATGVKVDTETGTETETSTNYFGILGKILALLQSICNAILGELVDAVNAIPVALNGIIEDAFVPDEEKVNVFVDDFNHKFGFVDDMKTNVDNIQKYIFGVTPSPILKIPIMKVNSKYDYGFGDYLIIDISWYEPYRPYGDLIILAFVWLMFIWRVFVSLPSIISGAPGNIWSNSSTVGTQPAIGMNDSTLIEDKRRGH